MIHCMCEYKKYNEIKNLKPSIKNVFLEFNFLKLKKDNFEKIINAVLKHAKTFISLVSELV